MVSTRLLTSKSSIHFNNSLMTVPRAPIIIGIIVNFMFHSFSNSLVSFRYWSFFSLFFNFILWSAGTVSLLLLLLILLLSFYSFESFSRESELMVFHWSLSDSKFPQVSRTLLSILSVFNNTVVWMVFAHSLIPSPTVPVPIFGDCTERTSYHWYHHHFHIPLIFRSSSKV